MSNIKRTVLGAKKTFLILLLAIPWIQANDIYSDINKTFPILKDVYREVLIRYVDDIDTEKFLKSGIDGMLSTLDPYSTYIEKEDKELLQILTDGKYEGVGMGLSIRNGIVTVVDPPFIGTPAARAGIHEGDAIIKVDGQPTQGLSLDETVQKIRGPAGSSVILTVFRSGVENYLDFTLIREKIKVEDVRYAGIIENGIGYIRLTKFSRNAAEEVQNHIQQFKTQDLKGIILDLRSNPGGVLDAAVQVSEIFLPKDMVIVTTRGRTEKLVQEFKSRWDPLYGEGPIVVLVNGGSASASEIVAGAIQDHDRGLVIGDTTFGKGLVQSIISLTPNSDLKLTTLKYYTPSGRCIQRQNYSIWADTMSTSEESAYHTDSGRLVFGGGGIIPDIVIRPEPSNDLIWDMQRQSLYFNFAVQYTSIHPDLKPDFQITDEMIDEFKEFLKGKNYSFKHPIEDPLSAFKSEILKSGYDASILLDIEKLQKSLIRTKDDMFQSSVSDIKKILKLEIASKAFGSQRESEIGLSDDPMIQKAVSLIQDKALYKNILE